jgi:hypothetical protein
VPFNKQEDFMTSNVGGLPDTDPLLSLERGKSGDTVDGAPEELPAAQKFTTATLDETRKNSLPKTTDKTPEETAEATSRVASGAFKRGAAVVGVSTVVGGGALVVASAPVAAGIALGAGVLTLIGMGLGKFFPDKPTDK